MEDNWGLEYTPAISPIELARDKYLWERVAKRFKELCKQRNALCHLCIRRGDIEHAQIDYGAKPNSPNAFEPDHVLPRSTHPELRFMMSNLAPSHCRCNRQRQDKPLDLLAPVDDWVKPDW